MRLLQGLKVTKYFRGLAALKEVDFAVNKGEIVGLIGPNGAGKTTLFNCIMGTYPLTSGKILFKEKDITHLKTHQVCRLGVGRTYQIVAPFLNMSVLENVTAGAVFGKSKSVSLTGGNAANAQEKALSSLDFVGLQDKKDVLAKNLTFVDRKMLELARTLATQPEILLIDEVISGLNPAETLRAMAMIRKIRDEMGITVLWIEHVMRALMNVAERIIVLHHGEKIAEGTPKEMASDKDVVAAYLGEKYVF